MNKPPPTSSVNTVGIDANRHTLGSNYKACTGCAACAAVCPSGAITIQDDHEGFKQPQINPEMCNECGLCREICPVNKAEADNDKPDHVDGRLSPPEVYAAWHLDESIRRESSSGGVFTALADNILAQGGVIVGAAFDEQLVVRHVLIEKSAEHKRLRGSKYVQSEISASLYHQIKKFLEQGRKVLFSGTPCQVAGLRGYLQKPYENLFCCDLVCHGVPSPLLFKKYLAFKQENGQEITDVCFRDKSHGWKNSYGVRYYFSNGHNEYDGSNPYNLVFLRNYALRESCYRCRFTKTIRSGDLTIGDFWGVAKKYPEYDRDDKGTSLILVNTQKGKKWLVISRSTLFLGIADLQTAVKSISKLTNPAEKPQQRDAFYRDLTSLPFPNVIKIYRLYTPTLLRTGLGYAKRKMFDLLKNILKLTQTSKS